MTAAQYESLLAISDAIHPLFALALIVGHETGHRIGAVRLLRWADLDLERQLVRRRGENDKIGYEHETWLTPTAIQALQTARRSQAVISEMGISSAGGRCQADVAALAPRVVGAGADTGQAAD